MQTPLVPLHLARKWHGTSVWHPCAVGRARWLLATGLVAGLLVGGCSAPDHTGVRFEGGVPEVVNCGTWIGAVEVSDDEDGRIVWAAESTELENGGRATRAHVVLGVLPAASWQETAPLSLEPRPTVWRFEIRGAIDPDAVIVVRDDEVEEGRVYRPSGDSESAAEFDEQTCSGVPIPGWIQRLILIGLVVCPLLALAVYLPRRRRRANSWRTAPPPQPADRLRS